MALRVTGSSARLSTCLAKAASSASLVIRTRCSAGAVCDGGCSRFTAAISVAMTSRIRARNSLPSSIQLTFQGADRAFGSLRAHPYIRFFAGEIDAAGRADHPVVHDLDLRRLLSLV